MSSDIKTSRLFLRPLQSSDAQAVFEIRSLDAVHVNFLTSQWTDPYEATLWIQETFDHKGMMYTISILSTPSSIIGTIGINRWNSLFYMLHPSHWNQGYCTEALKAFLRELWKHSPKRLTLSAAVIEGNTASQRVLEKCEFKKWDGWRHEEQHTKNPRSSAPTQEEEEGQRSEDEESIEVDAIIVDNDGKRRLSKIEAEELINAIEGLKVQTKPAIEPIRVDSVRPAPRKQAKLIIFRYERKLATDEVLDV